MFTQEVQNVKWNMKQAGVFSADASLRVSRGLTSDEAAEFRFMNACTPCVRPRSSGRSRLIHVSLLTPEFDSQSEDDDWHRVPVNPQDAKPGPGTPIPHPGRSTGQAVYNPGFDRIPNLIKSSKQHIPVWVF